MDFETMKITSEGKALDFSSARDLAQERVAEVLTGPTQVPECQHKPGWIAYAEGHGGRIRMDVNETEYSFIFADVA